MAYAALPEESRRRMIDAIVEDAQEEAVPPAVVLASLLAVESSTDLAEYLFAAMTRTGGEGLSSDQEPTGWAIGDADHGAAVVVLPLYGNFVEIAGLAWDEASGVTQKVFETMVVAEDGIKHVSALGLASTQHLVDVEDALDRMVSALWQHRRLHGHMPEGVDRMAALLDS